MKKIILPLLKLLLFALLLNNAIAQNIFPATGRVGIYTTAPAASLQVKGGARIGTTANYVNIDSATGNLSFVGTSAYRVAGNKYAFQYSGNTNYGLFFNSTNVQYEFRNGSAVSVFSVNANTGNSVFNGTLKVGTYTFPVTDGTSGQVLKTNGTGVLTWSNDNGGAGSGWSLTGNAGTNPAINFIGTTDAQPLVFRVNNVKAGFLGINGNIFWGQSSGNSNTQGYSNVAIGVSALYQNTTRSNLVAIGDSALYNNGTGAVNSFEASWNTAIGSKALYKNRTGYANTAVGYYALDSNTSGVQNTAVGLGALQYNATGHNNTAVAPYALYKNTSGDNNTAIGEQSLSSNTTGNHNTALGYFSLGLNTTGYSNIAIGIHALHSNTDRSNLVAIGDSALYNNGTGATGLSEALNNTAVGSKALFSNTTAYGNTATGSGALYNNNTSSYNSGYGFAALYFNTGPGNSGYGAFALYNNTIGAYNSSIGSDALFSNTSGSYNCAVGQSALGSNSTGSANTGIGYATDVTTDGLTNSTAIGYLATVDASNKIRLGNSIVTSIGGQVGWSTFSDGRYKKNIKEDVKGLSFINALHPITYTVDINGLNEYFDKAGKHDSVYKKMKAGINESVDKASKIVYNGFVAQEVEKAAAKLNYNFSGVDKPQIKDGLYGLRYADFVVPLVKAVQELSQQNDELKARLDKLEALLSQQALQSVELSDNAILEQNIPNPAKGVTTIRYSVPSYISSAYINVYSSSNTLIRSIKISLKGSGSVDLKISELSSGVYYYALLVDGKVIDKKQMLITR